MLCVCHDVSPIGVYATSQRVCVYVCVIPYVCVCHIMTSPPSVFMPLHKPCVCGRFRVRIRVRVVSVSCTCSRVWLCMCAVPFPEYLPLSFYVSWLMHISFAAYSSVWHDSFICVTRLIHICATTLNHACKTWLIHAYDTTYSHVRHESFPIELRWKPAHTLRICTY